MLYNLKQAVQIQRHILVGVISASGTASRQHCRLLDNNLFTCKRVLSHNLDWT